MYIVILMCINENLLIDHNQDTNQPIGIPCDHVNTLQTKIL